MPVKDPPQVDLFLLKLNLLYFFLFALFALFAFFPGRFRRVLMNQAVLAPLRQDASRNTFVREIIGLGKAVDLLDQ